MSFFTVHSELCGRTSEVGAVGGGVALALEVAVEERFGRPLILQIAHI